MQTFTATATTGATISKRSKLSFSHVVVYIDADGAIRDRASWASSERNALKVAQGMRKSAAKLDTVVGGFSVEICKATSI